MKSNEAQSFSRQLDMAMSDGKIKEQHLKEKLTTKVSLKFVFSALLMNINLYSGILFF